MTTRPSSNDLAIIGIGCVFPKADDTRAYWSNIKGRVDGITEVPPSHWDPRDYFDADPRSPDRTYGRRGGFLSPVDFDSTEFGISPNNIPATDPAQLLALVVAQAAMRDAGYGPQRSFDRRKVSVLLGVTGTLELAIPLGARLGHPVWRRALAEAGIAGEQAEAVIRRISDNYIEWQENSFPGLLGNVVAGRVANRLNLGGTNCVVDAACASSLSAAHLASLELGAGRADMVVTGGVDCFNDIFMFMCFSKTPALSPTGDSKPFDAKGDGTILGEGVGMVVLKRLADAERDDDRVYAVLKGIGSSSDGRGKAIYAPSPEGQVQALKNAYRLAGMSPDTVELVEAHGTGTKVGDAAELKALTEVYREAGKTGTWCALGSVKSNIGHTKAAAGSAGLIKAALALKHKVLPPTIKVSEPLPELASGETPFYVSMEKRPWMPAEGHPRRAAVSAFGFGGSNFHALLEEHRPDKAEIDWTQDVELVAFSGADASALAAQLDGWVAEQGWSELRVRAASSRKAFDPKKPARLVVAVEKGKAEPKKMFESLRETLRRNSGQTAWSTPEGAYFSCGETPGRLAALFPGQGAQYVGMGRDLACQFPAVHRTLAEADAAAGRAALAGRRLSDLIYPQPSFSPEAKAAGEAALRATDAAQPAIGAVSLGMLRLLELFGLRPEAAAGHSYGELTALCAAGRLSPEDLHRLSGLRGRLMAAGGGDKGTMLAAMAPIAAVQAAVDEEKLDVVLANKNAPEQVVLSGSTEAIAKARSVLEARGIRNTPLPVAAAFHSRLVADAAAPLREALEPLGLPEGRFPVFANTTAAPYPAAPAEAKDLLAGQLAKPVEFVSEVEAMHRDGFGVFLEIGPGARLTGLVHAILGERPHIALALDASAGRKSGVADLARALAQLASLGQPVDLTPWEDGERTLREQAAAKKPKVVVRVSGATPRGKAPARPSPKPAQPASGTTGVPSAAGAPPVARQMPHEPTLPVRMAPPLSATAAPAAAAPFASAPNALQLSQEGIIALQRLQEQASALHRQYLEGQEAAQKAVLGLIEQQTRMLLGSLAPTAALPAPAELPPRRGEPTAARRPSPQPPIVSSAEAVPTAPAAAPPSGRALEILLAVVSEKTGYPAETLNLDMGLEADLGIDSIKRVEILAAMREKLPDAPVVGPQHLGSLRTLRQIVDYLSGGLPSDPKADIPSSGSSSAEQKDSSPDAPSGEHVRRALLEIVSDKTGYPAETLNLDMGLEADLGIDSIKRVEILAAMREKLPEAPAVGPQHIGSLRTLRQIIEFLSAGSSSAEPERHRRPAAVPAAAPQPAAALDVSRSVLVAKPFEGARQGAPIERGAEVWIAGAGPDLGPALRDALLARGLAPRDVAIDGPCPEPASKLAALVVAAPESCLDGRGLWPEASERWLKAAFHLVRAAGPTLRRDRGCLLTLSRLDGAFGLLALSAETDPLGGALAGLAKTAGHEWPEVRCRALDAAPLEAARLAERLADELTFAGPSELGLIPEGLVVLEARPSPAASGPVPLEPGDVVLVTGGARGVTAETAVALAQSCRGPIALLGRTPQPLPEPDWLKPLTQEAEIKKALLSAAPRVGAAAPRVGAAANGSRPSPKEIEAAYRRHMANREVLSTLARLEAAGSKALYLAADLRDPASVRGALERIQAELGPIRALVHGAGVLADRFIEEKTAEQFDAVFDTKVAGLRHVLSCLDPRKLKAVVFFSSVSGRLGRAGQADYAMANEALNKIAQSLERRLPSARVVAVNWGPWDGGMVTPSLRKVFQKECVPLLSLAAGGRHLVSELASEGVEAIVQGGTTAPPEALATAFERTLDAQSHPFLSSHVINSRPVLPLAMILEWLAHGALHANPGLSFCGVDDLRVLKGVILHDGPRRLRVAAGKAERADALWRVPVELAGDSAIHARATVVLGAKLSAAPSARRAPALEPYRRSVEEAYRELLFHGPLLRGIETVEGCSLEGIAVRLKPAEPPSSWMRQPLRGTWLAEPLAIDAALQAVILWSFEANGAGCLPSALGRYRQYRAEFPRQGLRAVVRAVRRGDQQATADVDFLDARGELVAAIEGSEHTVDKGLREAFCKSIAA